MADPKIGRIEVAVGCMFSGKTEWLLSKLLPYKVAQSKILAIRYTEDNRYSEDKIFSHNKSCFEARSAKSVEEIKKIIETDGLPEVFGLDEMQFFNKELSALAEYLREKGVMVYLTGLDLDFKAEPWETSMRIMATADIIEKRFAVCSVCRKVNQATRTQRLIDGKPASKSSPRKLIGGTDSYTARCLLHYELPE